MAKPANEAIDVQVFSSTELSKIKKDLQEYTKIKTRMVALETSLKYNQQQLLLNHKDKKCYTLGLDIDKVLVK